MAPKKKLTPEQQASYDGVLARLQSEGLLSKAPARKRKPVDEPEEKAAAKPRGKAAKAAAADEDVPPTRKPKAKALPEKTTAKPEKPKAKASKPNPPETMAKPAREAATPSSEKKKKKGKASKCDSTTDSTREPSVAASLTGSSQSSNDLPMVYDEDLEMFVSWDTFDKVLGEVLKRYPHEGPDSVRAEMEKVLGPCPPNRGPLAKVGASSASKKAVDEGLEETQVEEEEQDAGEDEDQDGDECGQEGEEEENLDDDDHDDAEMEEEGDAKANETVQEVAIATKKKETASAKNPTVSTELF